MFNGIIKNTGKIIRIYKKKNYSIIKIKSKIKFSQNDIGESISCSGACLTIEKVKKNLVDFYISKETLNKTIFKHSHKGDIINLEKSLKFGQRISGHFVQGHVDTTSLVDKINIVGKSWVINFRLLKKYKKYIVSKGSITINGISLTIAKILKGGFQIAVIPKTLALTNLANVKRNNLVNVEFDVMAKYIKNFLDK